MTKKKNIEENSEAIEVATDQNMSLEHLAEQLAALNAEHRKQVIKTSKRLAKAYMSLEELADLMARENAIEDMEAML